ncbi:hypothetical protein ACPOLB_25190 [Rubrivivax sp. RP6-9]|uniref:oxidoreductase n=1 Tax=Rubrivivax sp. RP6-9 TaxID=3415750 RepID=UPI003CC5553F
MLPRSATPDLFTPWQLGALELRHRVVLPALTLGLALPGGAPGPAMVAFYARRATPGGLVVCEAAAINAGEHLPERPGLYSAEQVNQWRLLTEAVHDAGGLAVAQLGLLGAGARRSEALLQDLGADRIEQYLLDYRSAAENAGDAGFDAVELQACDDALPLRLLHGACADCDPAYRGTVESRLRFVDQALGSLVGVWGRGRVGLCLAPREPAQAEGSGDLAAYAQLLRDLDRAGLAWLHLVEPPAPRSMAALLRPHFAGEWLFDGDVDLQSANAQVRSGQAQGIAFARGFLGRTDLVPHLRGALGAAG